MGIQVPKSHFDAEQSAWHAWRSEEPEPALVDYSVCTATRFPSPQELVQQVINPNQIFDLVAHDVCVFGSTMERPNGSVAIEPDYADKKIEFSRAQFTDDLYKILADLDAAICCKKGKKPQQPNQDNISFCKMGGITMCAVADGHGPDGHWVSHWAIRFVLRLLMAEVGETGMLPEDAVLRCIFDLTHQGLRSHSKASGCDLSMSGSTLSVCLIEHENKRVVAAWVGDSRCVMGKNDGSGGVSLTQDHKPQNAEEQKRIIANGGEVLQLAGDVPHRIFLKNQELPGLAMSRAVGDCIAHSIGVIHEPEIVRYEVEDHFLLCCSDGVWEFIESSEAAQIIANSGRDKVWESVEILAREARARWLEEEEDVTDDISVVCIYV